MTHHKIFLIVSVILSTYIPKIKGQFIIGSTAVDTASIITSLDTPWEILWGPDNYLWFTERPGRVSRVNPTTGVREVLLIISDVHEESESGLLGMTLDNQFPSQPYVYLVYNYLSGSKKERIVRYTYTDNVLKNPVTLLENYAGSANHNGSRILEGPDNKLYVTTGDAQIMSNPQNLSSLNGKILRMNLDGSIPDDNPTTGSYIWTFGHRNPQGLLFTPNGKLYSSEHGPDNDDEINLIEKGRNYGWPDVMGFCNGASEMTFCSAHSVREPLYAWTPTLAVTGIDYYNNTAIPEWQGCILMTSLKANKLLSLKLNNEGTSISNVSDWFASTFGRLRDICISPDGRVFIAVSNRDGRGTPKPGDDRIIQIKPHVTTGTPSVSKDVDGLKIFPNPMKDHVLIQVKDAFSGSKLLIVTSIGKVVVETKMNGTDFDLNSASFESGYYIVKINNGKETVQSSLIVDK